jgi:hypothetical protein
MCRTTELSKTSLITDLRVAGRVAADPGLESAIAEFALRQFPADEKVNSIGAADSNDAEVDGIAVGYTQPLPDREEILRSALVRR